VPVQLATRSRHSAPSSPQEYAGLLSRMTPPPLSIPIPPALISPHRPSVEQLGEAIAASRRASTPPPISCWSYSASSMREVAGTTASCRAPTGSACERASTWELPLLSGALQRGEISYAKVRALTRIATQATEERLLGIAHHGTAAQVERLVRAWRRCNRIEEERKLPSRSASTYVDEDGMVAGARGRFGTPVSGQPRGGGAGADRRRGHLRPAPRGCPRIDRRVRAHRRPRPLGRLAIAIRSSSMSKPRRRGLQPNLRRY
jgi:hypothetical protein